MLLHKLARLPHHLPGSLRPSLASMVGQLCLVRHHHPHDSSYRGGVNRGLGCRESHNGSGSAVVCWMACQELLRIVTVWEICGSEVEWHVVKVT